jgi:hypothetical protein
MKFWMTQEQYDELMECGNSLEFSESIEAFDKTMADIANQVITDQP